MYMARARVILLTHRRRGVDRRAAQILLMTCALGPSRVSRTRKRSAQRQPERGVHGVQVDPTLTRADRLVGQVLGQVGQLPDVYTELEINFFLLRRLLGVRTSVRAAFLQRGYPAWL